ncbi:MAG: 3,4-dihydroxy-2-butanone-4-phosphate synthase [Gammaproteobacteria bacterium]|nr:3,4-dihydroxy-2-butanone-4-phosphate synthase [Gammaproteobacteria bacterium]
MALNSIEEIIEDIHAGRMVVIMDDENRENEGDFIMAAEHVRAEDINFMARHGRGLICLTLTQERCQRLNLPLMVHDTHQQRRTNFTISIEAATGVTTGISAADRARTVQVAVDADSGPADLTQPGHIFPLMAQSGGVLTRAGHTEAGCDLARLAGLQDASVIVEILNEDGTMARRPDLEKIAKRHGLKIGTIADLIRFRIENEKTVKRVAAAEIPTEFGTFDLVTYRDSIDGSVHMALVRGEISAEQAVLVRVHLHDPIDDLTFSVLPDSGWPLRDAVQRIDHAGGGVVVILNNQFDGESLVQKVQRYAERGADNGDTHNTEHAGATQQDLWQYGLGAQILADLGVKKMRVMSSPLRMHALSGFGLEVVEYVTGEMQ